MDHGKRRRAKTGERDKNYIVPAIDSPSGFFRVVLYLHISADLFVAIRLREHDEVGEMVERLMEQETRPAIFDTPPGTQNPSIPMAKM